MDQFPERHKLPNSLEKNNLLSLYLLLRQTKAKAQVESLVKSTNLKKKPYNSLQKSKNQI